MQIEAVRNNHFFADQVACRLPQDIVFDHFFTLISPVHVAKVLAAKCVSIVKSSLSCSVSYLRELGADTIKTVHTIFMKLLAKLVELHVVHSVTMRFLNFFIYDHAYDVQIASLQKELKKKTASTLYADGSKAIAKCVINLVKAHISAATEFDAAVRPPWLTPFLNQDDPSTYSFTGRIVCSLIRQHESLFEKVLETNFLSLFSSLIDHLLHEQGRKNFSLLHLIHEALEVVPAHFYACQNLEQAKLKGESDTDNFMPQEGVIREYFKALIVALTTIVLPQGAKGVKLPVSNTIASYARPFLLKLLQEELLPALLADLFKQTNEREALFLEVLELLHKQIDHVPEEADTSSSIESTYPEQDALNNALSECMITFLEYLDPAFFPWIVKQFSFAPQLIAKAAGVAISKRLEHMTFLDALQLGLEKLMPILAQPIPIHKKVVDVDAERLMRTITAKRKTEAIDQLVETIGKDPKGLLHIVKGKFYVAQDDEHEKGWLRKRYEEASSWLVESSFKGADVSVRINKLNKAFVQKMKQPEHALLLYDIIQKSVTVFGGKALFPNLHNNRFKKQPLPSTWTYVIM